MAAVLTIIFRIILIYVAAHIGSEKGYHKALCGAAGFFGGLGALILLLILPDQTEEQALQHELAALRQRIAELENAKDTPPRT